MSAAFLGRRARARSRACSTSCSRRATTGACPARARSDSRTPSTRATRASPLRPAIAAALASLASRGFSVCSKAEKLARLQALAQEAPAVFQALLVPAYGAYYTHPSVVEMLGLPPRPPFPKGYDVPPTDFSLLDPVRRRARLYRDI